MLGHLKGKCYKLVGYPPIHRLAKGKTLVANAVSQASRVNNPEVVNFLSDLTITPDQCQQILAVLTPQLQRKLQNYNQHSQDVIYSSFSMPDAYAFSGNRTTLEGKWIIDTGASEHMVCSQTLDYRNYHN